MGLLTSATTTLLLGDVKSTTSDGPNCRKWALQTPTLEMAHHKLCFSTKWAQRALTLQRMSCQWLAFLPTATVLFSELTKTEGICLPGLLGMKGATLAGIKISTVIRAINSILWNTYFQTAIYWYSAWVVKTASSLKTITIYIFSPGPLRSFAWILIFLVKTMMGRKCRWKLVCTSSCNSHGPYIPIGVWHLRLWVSSNVPKSLASDTLSDKYR